MRYHIISDNVFFLSGLEKLNEIESGSVFFFHYPFDIQTINSEPGDVFILYLSNIHSRTSLIKALDLQLYRTLILVDAPVHRTIRGCYPWVLNAAVSWQNLLSVLNAAGRIPVQYENKARNIRRIFELYASGLSVDGIAECLSVTKDYVYRVTREEVMYYGMSHCNRASTLICRDIYQITESAPAAYS